MSHFIGRGIYITRMGSRGGAYCRRDRVGQIGVLLLVAARVRSSRHTEFITGDAMYEPDALGTHGIWQIPIAPPTFIHGSGTAFHEQFRTTNPDDLEVIGFMFIQRK